MKNEQASMEAPFLIISLCDNFGRSRTDNSLDNGPIWRSAKFEIIQALKEVLIICKYEKYLIRNNRKKWRHRFLD